MFTVEEIKKQAGNTIERIKGRPGKELKGISYKSIRNECRKVLFLCKEIEKLRKQCSQTTKKN